MGFAELFDIKAEIPDIKVKKLDIQAELFDIEIKIPDIKIKTFDIYAEILDMTLTRITLTLTRISHPT